MNVSVNKFYQYLVDYVDDYDELIQTTFTVAVEIIVAA